MSYKMASPPEVVLFIGPGVNFDYGDLWVTNGTIEGTLDLTGIVGAAPADRGGLFPEELTGANGTAFFQGQDANGGDGLWVSNGTAQGTREVVTLNIPTNGGLTFGDSDAHIAAFNDGVLFNNFGELWFSDGTAQGTHEIYNGVFASSIVQVNSEEAMFSGVNSQGHGLWVSDGTQAGTHEVMDGLQTFSMTAFDNKVLFNSIDANDKFSLWISDGTSAGTQEIASGTIPAGMTVFNGEVLFSAFNADNQRGLWVTDGTAEGTHEIIGIANTGPNGLDPGGFTLFNGELLFPGTDADGQNGLWVTDGTADGTHEIDGTSGLNPTSMTVIDGEVWFHGSDGLEVTDGTADGTHVIADMAASSFVAIPVQPVVDTYVQAIEQRAPLPDEDTAYVNGIASGDESFIGVIHDLANTTTATTDVIPVVLLYNAIYGRVPDAGGLQFWTGVYANDLSTVPETPGSTVNAAMVTLAEQFVTAPEFTARFGGADPSTATFVTDLYTNVLNRTADSAGLSFWEGILNGLETGGTDHNAARATLLEQFVDSNEYVTNASPYAKGFLELSALGNESHTGGLWDHATDAQAEASVSIVGTYSPPVS